jgi:hypothetical protein
LRRRPRIEIHVSGIAAENVPRRRQHDVLQHGVAGEEHVIVADRAGAKKTTAALAIAITTNKSCRSGFWRV